MTGDQERAEKAANAMWAEDTASQTQGFVIESVSPGQASLRMVIKSPHANGLGICHGGFIFMLADSAFAFACNSYNMRTVAQHCTISFLAPAHVGDTLRAKAQETDRRGRSGIYDVEILNQDDTRIAIFRGYSRQIKGQLFEEPQTDD